MLVLLLSFFFFTKFIPIHNHLKELYLVVLKNYEEIHMIKDESSITMEIT